MKDWGILYFLFSIVYVLEKVDSLVESLFVCYICIFFSRLLILLVIYYNVRLLRIVLECIMW